MKKQQRGTTCYACPHVLYTATPMREVQMKQGCGCGSMFRGMRLVYMQQDIVLPFLKQQPVTADRPLLNSWNYGSAGQGCSFSSPAAQSTVWRHISGETYPCWEAGEALFSVHLRPFSEHVPPCSSCMGEAWETL